jgi:nickel-dependent lactate racemase
MALPNSLTVNCLLFNSDLIIATGVVEPHQYAGYSGGGKTVVIGCGSEETIRLTHGPQFLDHPGVRLGQVDGNLSTVRAGRRTGDRVEVRRQRRARWRRAGHRRAGG